MPVVGDAVNIGQHFAWRGDAVGDPNEVLALVTGARIPVRRPVAAGTPTRD